MRAYELESDQHFVRCFDTQMLWVYQLQTPNSDAVKEERWVRDDNAPLVGPTQDYDCLKVGGKEIKRNDLRELIKILYHSGLIVNPQGICFLDSGGLTPIASSDIKVQYFKLKNLFDWSCFQIIQPSPTKPDSNSESDARILDTSGLSGTDFFDGIVTRTRVKFPSGNFDVGSTEAKAEFPRAETRPEQTLSLDEDITPMDTKPSKDLSSLPIVPVQVSTGSFDANNWWLITVAIRNDWNTDIKAAIYYDPEIKSQRQRIGERIIAVPFKVGANFKHKQRLGIHMIHGVGIRFVFFI